MTDKYQKVVLAPNTVRFEKKTSRNTVSATVLNQLVVEISKIWRELGILHHDMEEFMLEVADHDLELRDLIEQKFRSYDRRR